MSIPTDHPFDFDPTHGMDLAQLESLQPPAPVKGFDAFWQARYDRVLSMSPAAVLVDSDIQHPDWRVFDVTYGSTDGITIGGWLLLPAVGEVRRALVVGHGYGGRTGPDVDFPVRDAALLFPCMRGLTRSAQAGLPDSSAGHVIHGIGSPDTYILGGCVEDTWLAVSSLMQICPGVPVGYAGTSFGGGIGALALAFDRRLDRGCLSVPTFGNMPLWLTLPSNGSANAAQNYLREHPEARATMPFFDAAVAASRIGVPMLVSPARFDPSVAPACQFSVRNVLHESGKAQTHLLACGHYEFDGLAEQNRLLHEQVRRHFGGA